MNFYSLGKYFFIDIEDGEVKKWGFMLNLVVKFERSLGVYLSEESLKCSVVGKRWYGGFG